MQVKLFWKIEPMKPAMGMLGNNLTEGNALELEREINDWLRANPDIKIVDIRQSASGGSLVHSLWLISIWYEASDSA